MKSRAGLRVRLDGNDLPECAVGLPDESIDHVAMMRAGVEQNFIAAQDGGDVRNEETIVAEHRRGPKSPFLAQPPPGQELEMMGTRHVVIPARQNRAGLGATLRRQGWSEPAIRQGMAIAEALGQVVEWHDVRKATLGQRALEWNIGGGDNADRQTGVVLGSLAHVVGMNQLDAGPSRFLREHLRFAVDDHGEVVPEAGQELACQLAQITRAIER